jgi:hypothetical protein
MYLYSLQIKGDSQKKIISIAVVAVVIIVRRLIT